MKIQIWLFLLFLLIFSNSNYAQESDSLAPEATVAEAAGSFRDIPMLEKAFIDAAPVDRKDGILVGELGVDGGNKEMILRLAQNIAGNHYGFFDSYLIAHKGKLLFESYFTKGRIDLPHPQASATKTYTGLALGRAIQLGYLTMADLDKPLVSFLKDLDPTKFVEGAELITLHKALTNTSGIRISEEQQEEIEKNPAALKGQGQVQVLLEHSTPITEASQSFKYGGGPRLIMQVIEAVVPGTAKDFIKNELFGKMGITNYDWQTAVTGLPEAGWRSSMTSRDMAKLGILAMNKGKWNGEQLIPEAFMAKGTSRIITMGEDAVYFGGCRGISNEGYGYFWWNADLKIGNKKYFSSSAQGGGGQFIILIEELDLVVVATAHNNRHPSTLRMTTERVLPAFIENSIATTSEKKDTQDKFPALEGPYLGQKPPGLIPELFAPDIVSTEEFLETVVTFSPNMKELYFTRYDEKYEETLLVMQYNNNEWSQPYVLSTDINKYKEQFKPSLSEIRSHAALKDIPIVDFSISSNGTIYFYVLDLSDGSGHMSYSRLINSQYEKPHKMSKAINTGKYIAHPFIAPDESYLMWDAEKDDENTPDIYISFREKDGSWGTAINMGNKINSPFYEQHARVTPDGKYLFFWKGDVKVREDGSSYVVGSPYWADAKIIDNLRPNNNLRNKQ